ncbi:MAG: DUF456 family protein [Planctomycetota bacterium]
MDWLLYLSLVALNLTGLGLNLIGLPGLWLMVGAHGLYAWLDRTDLAGWESAIALLILAGVAEGLEFVAGAAGSKAAGGSFRSAIGAVIGGVVGGLLAVVFIPFVPVLNAILGACVGSFAGAALLEASKAQSTVEDRMAFYRRIERVGRGAFWGRLWGVLLKSAIGVVMLVVSLITAWS